MRSGDYAWIVMAAAILAYEITAPRGELLSQAADRYRQRHPVATHIVIIYLAGHLARVWPTRLDPLHRLAAWADRA